VLFYFTVAQRFTTIFLGLAIICLHSTDSYAIVTALKVETVTATGRSYGTCKPFALSSSAIDLFFEIRHRRPSPQSNGSEVLKLTGFAVGNPMFFPCSVRVNN
jgi:hypothetical protein